MEHGEIIELMHMRKQNAMVCCVRFRDPVHGEVFIEGSGKEPIIGGRVGLTQYRGKS